MVKAKKEYKQMENADKARLVRAWLEDKKADNIVAMDVAGISPITEALVIATATSVRHAKGLAAHVIDEAGRENIEFLGVEGQQEGMWILVDLNDVLVHIFFEEVRDHYNLEGLWSEGTEIPTDD